MSISEKNRKILWARSGNRCAFCRVELISDKDDNNINLNIGEECHIISKRTNGPRYKMGVKNYDSYDNLILLCRNHHRMIDEQFQTYSEQVLNVIKHSHEKWVKTVFDREFNSPRNSSRILNRIYSGKELLDIVDGMHASEFEYDVLENENEVQIVGSFLQNLRDWADLFSMGVIETQESIKIGYNFNKELKQIENLGFWVFGKRRKAKIFNGSNEDIGIWNVATIYIVRSNNPNIINIDKFKKKNNHE